MMKLIIPVHPSETMAIATKLMVYEVATLKNSHHISQMTIKLSVRKETRYPGKFDIKLATFNSFISLSENSSNNNNNSIITKQLFTATIILYI